MHQNGRVGRFLSVGLKLGKTYNYVGRTLSYGILLVLRSVKVNLFSVGGPTTTIQKPRIRPSPDWNLGAYLQGVVPLIDFGKVAC